MSAVRQMVVDQGGLPRNSRNGDNPLTSFGVVPIATDAALTLTAAQIAGGIVQFTSFSAGRTVTTDTAVNILASLPNMDIGDVVLILVSVQTAFAATWAAGVGVTLAGKATTPASGATWIAITKTGAATIGWNVL